MNEKEESTLVTAALSDKKANRRLRDMMREIAVRIAALYLGEGATVSARRMTAAAMQQFNPLLNEYGNQRTKRRGRVERFSFVFGWWATRRMEQLLREAGRDVR